MICSFLAPGSERLTARTGASTSAAPPPQAFQALRILTVIVKREGRLCAGRNEYRREKRRQRLVRIYEKYPIGSTRQPQGSGARRNPHRTSPGRTADLKIMRRRPPLRPVKVKAFPIWRDLDHAERRRYQEKARRARSCVHVSLPTATGRPPATHLGYRPKMKRP